MRWLPTTPKGEIVVLWLSLLATRPRGGDDVASLSDVDENDDMAVSSVTDEITEQLGMHGVV